MDRFVPYAKLSKKQRKAVNEKRRGSWEGVTPVTKIKPSAKLYNRKKDRLAGHDDPAGGLFISLRTDRLYHSEQIVHRFAHRRVSVDVVTKHRIGDARVHGQLDRVYHLLGLCAEEVGAQYKPRVPVNNGL